MPELDTLRSRIDALEAKVAELENMAELVGRLAGGVERRNPRPAKTCKKDGVTAYPTAASEPNTYYIQFLDSTYTESEGDQTPSDTARQSTGRYLAHMREAERYRYLPEGSIVGVFHDRARWWIICDPETEPEADVICAEVNMAGGLDTTDANITIDTVSTMLPRGASTPTVTSIPNTFDWEADNNAPLIAIYDQVLGNYKPVQVQCPS